MPNHAKAFQSMPDYNLCNLSLKCFRIIWHHDDLHYPKVVKSITMISYFILLSIIHFAFYFSFCFLYVILFCTLFFQKSTAKWDHFVVYSLQNKKQNKQNENFLFCSFCYLLFSILFILLFIFILFILFILLFTMSVFR